ncbi:unnamed protein product [Fraxinus pennsylvanica]|uniref:SMP domain-containing protein n=1 Tax=Fraxinus pennsylvanica TaxID=56036 RepID=A0AAD1ZGT8_9LAMI|nr:unnamed protein product [Fraxinus pennsylvanica]
MSQEQPQRPKPVRYGDVFHVQGELASKPVAPQDSIAFMAAENIALGKTQEGGPAAVVQSAADVNETHGVVHHDDMTNIVREEGIGGPDVITIGEALEATAFSAGNKPVDESDPAAVQAAEIRATGLCHAVPGGVAAEAQSAAAYNARTMRDEDKTKLGDILIDAATKLTNANPSLKNSYIVEIMGTLAHDNENVHTEEYVSLGLKESGIGNLGTPQVLSLLSTLLERSVQKNERILEATKTKDAITIFHGSRAPSLGIRQYIDRIFKYSRCSPSCFVIAHIYVDRFIQRTNMLLTSLNIHRVIITSVMVAAKFIDDAFFNNAYYARVGGVSTAELNKLEMKFLFGLDFQLHVTLQTFRKYCSLLAKDATDVLQIERLISGMWNEKELAKKR